MRDSALTIEDTAFAVAYCRAGPWLQDGVPHDILARAVVGTRGKKAAHAIGLSKADARATAVRTAQFDLLIKEFCERLPAAVVLNLGAGLDTRPYRLQLPSGVKFLEVDSAPLIAF